MALSLNHSTSSSHSRASQPPSLYDTSISTIESAKSSSTMQQQLAYSGTSGNTAPFYPRTNPPSPIRRRQTSSPSTAASSLSEVGYRKDYSRSQHAALRQEEQQEYMAMTDPGGSLHDRFAAYVNRFARHDEQARRLEQSKAIQREAQASSVSPRRRRLNPDHSPPRAQRTSRSLPPPRRRRAAVSDNQAPSMDRKGRSVSPGKRRVVEETPTETPTKTPTETPAAETNASVNTTPSVKDLKRQLWDNNETLQVSVKPSLHDDVCPDRWNKHWLHFYGPEMAGREGQRMSSREEQRRQEQMEFLHRQQHNHVLRGRLGTVNGTHHYNPGEHVQTSVRRGAAPGRQTPTEFQPPQYAQSEVGVASTSPQPPQYAQSDLGVGPSFPSRYYKAAAAGTTPQQPASDVQPQPPSQHQPLFFKTKFYQAAMAARQRKSPASDRHADAPADDDLKQDSTRPPEPQMQNPPPTAAESQAERDAKLVEEELVAEQHALERREHEQRLEEEQKEILRKRREKYNAYMKNRGIETDSAKDKRAVAPSPPPTSEPKSVASLVAKLNAVSRDDPKAALEQIDSILKAESRASLGEPEKEHKPSSSEEESTSSSEESSVSSITNPTYVSSKPTSMEIFDQVPPAVGLSTSSNRRPRPNALSGYTSYSFIQQQKQQPPVEVPKERKPKKIPGPPPPTIQVKQSQSAESDYPSGRAVEAPKDVATADSGGAGIGATVSPQSASIPLSPALLKMRHWDVGTPLPPNDGATSAGGTEELGSIITPPNLVRRALAAETPKESLLSSRVKTRDTSMENGTGVETEAWSFPRSSKLSLLDRVHESKMTAAAKSMERRTSHNPFDDSFQEDDHKARFNAPRSCNPFDDSQDKLERSERRKGHNPFDSPTPEQMRVPKGHNPFDSPARDDLPASTNGRSRGYNPFDDSKDMDNSGFGAAKRRGSLGSVEKKVEDRSRKQNRDWELTTRLTPQNVSNAKDLADEFDSAWVSLPSSSFFGSKPTSQPGSPSASWKTGKTAFGSNGTAELTEPSTVASRASSHHPDHNMTRGRSRERRDFHSTGIEVVPIFDNSPKYTSSSRTPSGQVQTERARSRSRPREVFSGSSKANPRAPHQIEHGEELPPPQEKSKRGFRTILKRIGTKKQEFIGVSVASTRRDSSTYSMDDDNASYSGRRSRRDRTSESRQRSSSLEDPRRMRNPRMAKKFNRLMKVYDNDSD